MTVFKTEQFNLNKKFYSFIHSSCQQRCCQTLILLVSNINCDVIGTAAYQLQVEGGSG